MKPYYEDDTASIFHGEALAVLDSVETASVDVLLTDPPYSSGGMFRSDRAQDPAAKYRGWSQNADGSSRKPTAQYGTFGGDCQFDADDLVAATGRPTPLSRKLAPNR